LIVPVFVFVYYPKIIRMAIPHKYEFVSGEELRKLRTLKGLKQETVAIKLGISRQAYSKTERCNNVNIQKAVEILAVFNCTLNDLENLRTFLPHNINHQAQ
jgi:transcriptional regulator with XRE-family HTH domain